MGKDISEQVSASERVEPAHIVQRWIEPGLLNDDCVYREMLAVADDAKYPVAYPSPILGGVEIFQVLTLCDDLVLKSMQLDNGWHHIASHQAGKHQVTGASW